MQPSSPSARATPALPFAALGLSLLTLFHGCEPGRSERPRRQASAAGAPARSPTAAEKPIDDNLKVLLLLARGSETPGATPAQTRTNYESALEIYRKIIASGARGKALHAAWFGAGRCLAALGRDWEAFICLERSFPPQLAPKGVQRRVSLEYAIGKRLMDRGEAQVVVGGGDFPGGAATRKKLSGLQAASRVFNQVVYNDPRSSEAPAALLLLGDCEVRLGHPDAAARAYRRLLRGGYETTRQAYEARAALAGVLVGKDYGGELPPAMLREARELLGECALVRNQWPALKSRIREARTKKLAIGARDLMRQARFHLKRGNRRSATFLLQEILRSYPGTRIAGEARNLLGHPRETKGDTGHAPAPPYPASPQ